MLTGNTLLNNGHWDSEKVKLEMGVMGAWNFFSQTQPLNGNHLNLGAWHGFQEIISRKTFQYDQLEFDALIRDDAYLISHITINENLKTSIKISSKPTESFCLEIDQNGKFLKKISLNNLQIKSNQWFHTQINLSDGKATIKINDQIITCDISNTSPTKIGFKGGYADTLIDNLIIKSDSKIIFKENFSNSSKLIPITISIFIVLTLIQIIFNKKKKVIFTIALINTSLLISEAIFYAYLLLVFTGNYPNPKSFLNNLKKQEQELTSNKVDLISNEVMSKFKEDEHEKIMFVGSSQTWGAGVSTDKKIQVINTGVSVTVSSELLHEYQGEWIKLQPKTIFINLSSNDFTQGDFKEKFKNNIETFIEINKKNNIETILLVEANSAELDINNPLHEVLVKIARDKDILLIDINQYLKNQDDTGLLWWDYIHPTDYGHQLIAKYILNIVNTKIEST